MNSKTMSIGVMSITALILAIAHLIPVQPVIGAGTTIKDRDYALATGKSTKGGEILYVTENRTGQIAVFAWDASGRSFQPAGTVTVTDAFR
jgi:hypothetical protein